MRYGFRIGRWRVRPELGEIDSGDEVVLLKPRLMGLLVYFAEHAGHVLSKERLLDTLWKDTFVAENTLMNAVSELRKALGDDRREPEFIVTLSKRGYRWIAPVEDLREFEGQKSRSLGPALRLAVLPFVCRHPDSVDDAVAEALTDMVVTALASSKVVRVVSRISTFRCWKDVVTLPEIGRQLEVQRLVEGEVYRGGDRLQVTVRLYNELDDGLWGEIFELGSSPGSLVVAAQEISTRVEEKVSVE